LVYINAISYHFPDQFHENEQIIQEYLNYGGDRSVKISSEDIYNQCGINKRYSSQKDETAKDLGNSAAIRLFDEWNIKKNEIEYIIFISDALDYKGPTTACVMQNDLGLENGIGAIDVLHGCTGWVYGLSIAKALIISEQVSNVLVITADTPTKVVHPKDIELRAIFSDAGAATLLSNKKIENGINTMVDNFIFGTDGEGEKNLYTSRSATKNPADIEWLNQFKNVPGGMTRGRLVMNSPQIFLFALRKVPLLIEEVLIKNNIKFDEIDYFILHQANGQMLEFIRNRLKIPKEKFITNIEDIGNTVSATIPIAFYDALKNNKFKTGDKILVAGFGIGYSWGATILSY
jgi:3-oxoacyl-[acyl-carrier-protein] synthase-3